MEHFRQDDDPMIVAVAVGTIVVDSRPSVVFVVVVVVVLVVRPLS